MRHARRAPRRFQAPNVWAVTGTPFTSSLNQLRVQSTFLGQADHGINVGEIIDGVANPVQPGVRSPLANDEVVSRLRKLMMRHTKVARVRALTSPSPSP